MIFVTGASSSGKTYSINLLVQAMPDLLHIRASRVLSSLGLPLRLQTKQQAAVNQEALIGYLTVHGLAGQPNVILDGHGVVETTEGPYAIPDEVTNRLGLMALIGIYDSTNAILERRWKRGMPWTSSEAATYQRLEEAYLEHNARRLGIPARR